MQAQPVLSRWASIVVAILALSILPGLAVAQTETPTITLDASANGGSTTIVPGAVFAVSLAENPSTGYTWQLQPLGEVVVGVIGDRFVPESGDLRLGAGGRRVITFAALTPGTETLILRRLRSGEVTAAPSDTFSVTITVEPRADGGY